MKRIAIIGAGAAGLFAAKKLSECADTQVFVFEKSNKVGIKLRASGGGRANIFNTNIQPEHYNNANFMQSVLARVSSETVRNEFTRIGLRLTVDEEGRVYPATLFAATVVDTLLNNLGKNVRILCETPLQELTSSNGKWLINNEKTHYDNIILATGSPAGMIAKKQENYNRHLQCIQLQTKPLQPSLSGFKIKKYPSFLAGCKSRAEISLFQDKKLIFKEIGEVIFKEDGISGIVVLNASAHYNRLTDKNGCEISLNFLFDDPKIDISQYLQKFGSLTGILHPKLCKLYEKNPFDLRDFRMAITGCYPLEFAQVSHGGIAVTEIDENFQLKKHSGIYSIGEMVDIVGVCGGYNLFFAFASALIATEEIKRNFSKKI